MKKNTPQIFQTLVFGSINKLKEYYATNSKVELERLNDTLKSDKSMKELDANKFFYVFELMFETKHTQLVDEALKCIHDLIAERFMNPSKDRIVQQSLLRMLRKVINKMPEIVANILIHCQSPTLQMLSLLFQVYPLCMFEVTAQRVRTAGLNIIARIFSFKRKEVSTFTLKIFKLFKPIIAILPDQQLTTGEEQQHLLKYYISKVLSEVVTKVQLALDSGAIEKGKFGLCFMCRAPAHFYCKDTKVPVCSADCKRTHLEELNKVTWLTSLHHDTEKKQIEKFLFGVLNESTKDIMSRILAANYLIEILLSSEYILNGSVSFIQEPSPNNIYELKKLTCLLLYLSTEQKGQFVEHIFLDLLLFSQSPSDYRVFCEAYFKELFDSDRLFDVYFNFDMSPYRINLVRDCLSLLWPQNNGKIFVESLINNVFAHNNKLLDDKPYQWIADESEVVAVFNESFQKGYDLFTEKYKGTNLEKDFAYFLRKNQKSLNRQKLGQFFAKNQPQNQRILELFLELLNLNSLEIDQALREVFYHFSVGQSQQIFRVIESFTKVYTNKRFANADELFQFSYFILMLQTELHNPAIEKRMTVADMVARVSAFNKTLVNDVEYLSYIYNNIKGKPFSQTEKKPRYKDFEVIESVPTVPYSKSLILYHNWNTIYSVLSTQINFRKMQLIYRVSFSLIHYDIAHIFVGLLLKQLHKVDFLTRNLVEEEAFLISSVLTLIWHQPNHVRKEWRKILVLLAQYEILLDCLDTHKTEDLTQSHLERNHQKLRLYLSQTQINRLFHMCKDFTSQNFLIFCESLSTIPQSYFLPELSKLVELNSTRIYDVWPYLCGYLNLQQEQSRLQPYRQIFIILHQLLNLAEVSEHHPTFLTMITDILLWLSTDPKVGPLLVQTVISIILECKQQIHREVWKATVKAFRPTQLRIEFAANLKELENKTLFEDYVTTEVVETQDALFLKENISLFKTKPQLIEPHLKNFKSKQILRCFITPIFSTFILSNLSIFPPTPELNCLLRTTCSTLSTQLLLKVHQYVIEQLKNLDAEIIQLAVSLLATTLAKQVLQTITKIVEICQTQFPELNRSITLGVQDKLTDLQTFKMNYNIVVKKTVLDLVLLKSIQQIVGVLTDETRDKLQEIVASAVKTSRAFNRNIALRYLLWKDGLLKDLKQLPGLLKKQRNATSLLLQIMHLQALTTQSWLQYLKYSSQLLTDLSDRFASYLNHFKYYTSCSRDDLNYYYFNEIERQIADYRKIVGKVPGELVNIDWSKQDKELSKGFVKATVKALKVGLFKAGTAGFGFEVTSEEELLNQIVEKIVECL